MYIGWIVWYNRGANVVLLVHVCKTVAIAKRRRKMRKLTITRKKSFVGCVCKNKVYIQDPAGTTTIGDDTCTMLGTLKNGETATFEITEDATKVYVIADQMSKEYCNDCYHLPEGTEDVELSGKGAFNPAAGNAFLFDNNDHPQALEARKKNKKTGIIILIVAAVVGFVIGFLAVSGIG